MEAPADRRPAAETRHRLAGARSLEDAPRRLRSGWLAARRAVTFAACRAAEKARELRLEDGPRSEYHGTLTYHLVKALFELESEATWQDVFDRVAPQVSQRYLASIRWSRGTSARPSSAPRRPSAGRGGC